MALFNGSFTVISGTLVMQTIRHLISGIKTVVQILSIPESIDMIGLCEIRPARLQTSKTII